MPATQPMMILIAGPYRSGTNDDPVLIAANVRAMNEMPLVELAGSQHIGDAIFNEIFHPIARQLVACCDACLRLGGPSQGADEVVEVARQNGKPIFQRFEYIPAVQ